MRQVLLEAAQQIERANNNPKRKMALISRWYFGISSRWSNAGEQGREMDYQIWCGPSIGPFNDWTRDTYLSDPANRRVVDVAFHLFTGAAFLYRVEHLKAQIKSPPVLTATRLVSRSTHSTLDFSFQNLLRMRAFNRTETGKRSCEIRHRRGKHETRRIHVNLSGKRTRSLLSPWKVSRHRRGKPRQ